MNQTRFLVLALAASIVASATAQVVDRGLPDANLNNAAGANRSNVAWAYDYGNTGIEGDTFTMPTLGGGQSWVINDIRTWVVIGKQPQTGVYGPGDEFSDTSLYLGSGSGGDLSVVSTATFTGSTTTNNANVAVQRVAYNNGTEHDYQGSSGVYIPMYQIDYSGLNIAAASGSTYSFGSIGTAVSNTYAWFNHASNAALGGVPADGADGLINEYDFTGHYIDQYNSNGNGWDKSSDINVQVFATAVPEPASMAALGIGALALIRRRRSKKA